MLDVTTNLDTKPVLTQDIAQGHKATHGAPVWETPKLEDVSEQVMAQPYIRFT